jgi:hypothetical protein
VWHVWGYTWYGSRWVRQPDHCLATNDPKQAADYYNAIVRCHDWSATTDLPSQCFTFIHYNDGYYPQVPEELPTPSFQVWAFKLSAGQWVKQAAYSHEFQDPERVWQYLASVNAVPGWRAMTDLPPRVPSDKQTVHMYQAVQGFPYSYWYTRDSSGEVYFHWIDGTVAQCTQERCTVDGDRGGRKIHRPLVTVRIGF